MTRLPYNFRSCQNAQRNSVRPALEQNGDGPTWLTRGSTQRFRFLPKIITMNLWRYLLRPITFPLSYLWLEIRRFLLRLMHHSLQRKDDCRANLLISPLQTDGDASHARAKVAIYASLSISIFSVYSFCTPFAAAALECSALFQCADYISSSAHQPLSRERFSRCSLHALDSCRRITLILAFASTPV